MTKRLRLSTSAQEDIVEILSWSHREFGQSAAHRYESLIAAALHDIASAPDGVGSTARPERGQGIHVWHLALSRTHVPPGVLPVRRPRHFIVFRPATPLHPQDSSHGPNGSEAFSTTETVVEVVRILHDALELSDHLVSPQD